MTTATVDDFPLAHEENTPLLPPARRPSLMRLLLRGHQELNAQLRNDGALPGIVAKLLGMSVLGFALHGVAVGIAAQLLRHELYWINVKGHPVVWLPIALVGALIGALGICLPIFYFCSQMAGLDAPLRVIAAQALRANAASAALLLGVLPFYVALALGAVAGLHIEPMIVLGAGLVMPFVVGLTGVRSVYLGFADLARTMPSDGGARRRTLILAMVVCAAFVYALVAPVALYRLGEVLSMHL